MYIHQLVYVHLVGVCTPTTPIPYLFDAPMAVEVYVQCTFCAMILYCLSAKLYLAGSQRCAPTKRKFKNIPTTTVELGTFSSLTRMVLHSGILTFLLMSK